MGFFSHIGTGFKAILGSIIHSIAIGVLSFLFITFAGGYEQLSFGAIMVLIILSVIIGVFLLGWIYNALWGWD